MENITLTMTKERYVEILEMEKVIDRDKDYSRSARFNLRDYQGNFISVINAHEALKDIEGLVVKIRSERDSAYSYAYRISEENKLLKDQIELYKQQDKTQPSKKWF